ncbi:MAG: AAC(3) family N-acetyltransferase, partial [Planctomycetota bacterium]
MNQQEIEKGLQDLGLKKGDIVLLHSALSSLGKVEGGTDTLINAFLNVLGSEGTLVVPTFAGGAVPLAVQNHEKAVSSIAPTAFISAIGKDAEELCKDHYKNETAHAEGTPYARIAEKGGYILMLGVDQDRNTTLHSVEEFLRLPYMKDTKPVEIDTPDGKMEKSWKFFPGPHRDFIGLDRFFRDSGKMIMGKIGNAVARLIKSQDLLDIGGAIGKSDPAFVLCENPNCGDCVKQNSDIIRDELKKEAFTLATSSSLAGRYIPEMIENCKKKGIDNIELDYIQGKAAADIQTGILAGYVHELSAAKINITGVRFNAVTDDIAEKFTKVKEQGIKRVILPLVE